MTRDNVKSGEYTPNRVQRIALAVRRRRKPLAHMFPWAQSPGGCRMVFSGPNALAAQRQVLQMSRPDAQMFMQQQMWQQPNATTEDWMRWMGALS